MKEAIRKLHSLLAELKRRHVYTVAAAYTVGAWIIVEGASVILPTFDAPSWAMRGLIIAAVAGLPLAIVLSWIFDITEAGVSRTEELDADESSLALDEVPDSEREESDQLTIDGERRLISVLCCSLDLPAGQQDPELLLDATKEFISQCEHVIALYDGRLVKAIDDEFVAYFGYPRAGETDAQNAVRSGLGIIEAVGQVAANLGLDFDLSASVGIHSGLVVVQESPMMADERDLAIIGETPKTARLLKNHADPDCVVISDSTQNLTQGYFFSQEMQGELPGGGSTAKYFRVRAESGARTRLEAQGLSDLPELIDREYEMSLLAQKWTEARDGHGQIVLVSGEAGIGKSRLIHALTERVAAQPDTWLTPISCSLRHQSTPLHPFVDLLESTILGFKAEHSTSEKLSKLRGFLVQFTQPLADVLPLFATLLSLPSGGNDVPEITPRELLQRTLDAIISLLLERAQKQPLLMVVEDIHWADPTTLQFISMLAEYGPLPRILVILTCRPPLEQGWSQRANVTQLNLERLAPSYTQQLIRSVARGTSLTAKILHSIAERSDGVPLYTEELTKAILEMHDRSGNPAGRPSEDDLTLPATLQESLLSRLDNLEDIKPITQLCAAIGRTFSYELLVQVSGQDENYIRSALSTLVKTEFLYQRGTPPLANYTFKHALIQEIAYQAILKRQRTEFHGRIVDALEQNFPAVVETQPELIAWHCTQAKLDEKALNYWRKAGQRALSRYANQEAIAHLERALQTLEARPDSRERDKDQIGIFADLGAAHLANEGYASPGAGRSYRRALDLSERIGDVQSTTRFTIGLWQYHVMIGEFETAHTLTRRLLEIAQTHKDTGLQVHAHYALSFTLFSQGDFRAAYESSTRAVDLFEREADFASVSPLGTDSRVHALCWTAPILWHVGLFRKARERADEAIRLARELGNPYTLSMALLASNWSQQGKLETENMAERACECLTISREKGLHFWEHTCTFILGWLEVLGEKPIPTDNTETSDHGIERMRSSLENYRQVGARTGQVYMWSRLAQAYILTGRFDEAEETLRVSLTTVASSGERNFEAELWRLTGELRLLHDDGRSIRTRQEAAEEHFGKAINIANSQGARALELRAATSLAKLYRTMGDGHRMHEQLVPLCAEFPVDEKAPDLIEARQVMQSA